MCYSGIFQQCKLPQKSGGHRNIMLYSSANCPIIQVDTSIMLSSSANYPIIQASAWHFSQGKLDKNHGQENLRQKIMGKKSWAKTGNKNHGQKKSWATNCPIIQVDTSIMLSSSANCPIIQVDTSTSCYTAVQITLGCKKSWASCSPGPG